MYNWDGLYNKNFDINYLDYTNTYVKKNMHSLKHGKIFLPCMSGILSILKTHP